MMRIPRRDVYSTGLVAAAAVLYVLWLADLTLPGMSGTRATGIVHPRAPGFAASATAVVPGFDQLLHGNKAYLVASSLLGLVAFVAGVLMLWSAESATLAVLMVVMVTLWAVATTHHTLMARTGPSPVGAHG